MKLPTLKAFKALVPYMVLVVVLIFFLLDWRHTTQLEANIEKYKKQLDSLEVVAKVAEELRVHEVRVRRNVQDSLEQLRIINAEILENQTKITKRYEKIKNLLPTIDTDYKRDSLLSKWYPSPGRRNFSPFLEDGHDD